MCAVPFVIDKSETGCRICPAVSSLSRDFSSNTRFITRNKLYKIYYPAIENIKPADRYTAESFCDFGCIYDRRLRIVSTYSIACRLSNCRTTGATTGVRPRSHPRWCLNVPCMGGSLTPAGRVCTSAPR